VRAKTSHRKMTNSSPVHVDDFMYNNIIVHTVLINIKIVQKNHIQPHDTRLVIFDKSRYHFKT